MGDGPMVQIGRPLLQVGSNLFELIEFTATKCQGEEPPTLYGVNVAKVREVIRLPKIVPCLSHCPEVLGVFNLRGLPIPAIHLAKALGFQDEPVAPGAQVIVTEFSRRVAGFIVNGTRRIRRVSWDRVLPPSSEAFASITGMMLIENGQFIFILDFERILLEIEGRGSQSADSAASLWERAHPEGFARPGVDTDLANPLATQVEPAPRASHGAPVTAANPMRILAMVVDDSPTARRALCDMLRGMGIDVIEFTNGEQAWVALNDPRSLQEMNGLRFVVSDVEMPRMDGYTFVKKVKAEGRWSGLPIILHSSLTGEVNRERAKTAGADAYVSKLNRRELVDALKLILTRNWQPPMGVA